MREKEKLVWNTDVVETMEFENLTDQVAQICTVVRRTTNHEELTPMNFPERDDVQWIKNMNRHRSNDVWIENLDTNISAAESEVGVMSWNAQSEYSRSSTTQNDEVRANMTSASKADEAADAEKSVFELQQVQSTSAVSYARQVETVNAQSTFESNPATSKADVRSTTESENKGADGPSDFESTPQQS